MDLNFLLSQNEYTLWLFIASLVIDVWALRRVYNHVHDMKLLKSLIIDIVTGVIGSLIFLAYGGLFNFWIFTIIAQVLIRSNALVDIHEKREVAFKKALEKINEQLKNK